VNFRAGFWGMNRSFSGRKLVRVGQKVPDRKRTREKYDQQLKGKKPPKPNQTKKKNPTKNKPVICRRNSRKLKMPS
jgi:hypothetical protein